MGPGARETSQAEISVRVLGLRIDFLSDRMGSLTTSEGGRFDLRRGTSLFIDPPPHNRDYFESHLTALSRYYSAMSFGKIEMSFDVFPASPDSAFHLSDTADYGPWTFSQDDYAIAERLITDAVEAADRSSEPINFSQYDLVVIFHAGADLQGDVNDDSSYDIPSFSAGLEHPVPVDGGSAYVYAAMVIPETVSQDGLTGALNGVLTHETGHMLGLPDLYNTDDFLPSVGYWSLMDTGNYLGGFVEDPTTHEYVYVFGLIPAGLDAYCRRELGRILDVAIEDEVNVGALWSDTLQAVEVSSRVLNVPLSSSEYFLIENRQAELDGNNEIRVTADTLTGVVLGPESGEYDALLPGSGILVWHIDENTINSRAVLGLSPNGGLTERGIDLEEADGIEDLGNPSSWEWLGSEFDPYFVGNATLLNPETVPNSDANSGSPSQVYVTVESPRQLGMRLTVERKRAREGWPVVAHSLGEAVTGFGDFEGDGELEVFLAAGDSTLRAWRASGFPYLAGQPEGLFARAPSGIMPSACFSQAISLLAATVFDLPGVTADSGRVYAWAVSDEYAPVLPGQVLPGWPPGIPAVTTSPCAVGNEIVVGCSDGRVYGLDSSGGVAWRSTFYADYPVTGTLAAGDLDNNGDYEVAYCSGRRFLLCASSVYEENFFPPFSLPQAAADDSLGPFVMMADVDGKPDSTLEVLVVLASGDLYSLDSRGQLLDGWPVSLGDRIVSWPSAGDVDGDGLAELLVNSLSGRLYVVNGSGVVSSGWPFDTETPGEDYASGVLAVDLSGDGASELIFPARVQEMVAMTVGRVLLDDWPIPMGAELTQRPGLTDLEADGRPELFLPLADSLVWCLELPYSVPQLEWPVAGCTSRRTNCLERWVGFVGKAGQGIFARGSVYTQPNPSRAGWTSIRFTLNSAATVTMEIFDLSGRKVYSSGAEFAPAENAIVWSNKGFPPGVYVIRLEAMGAETKEVAFTRASVIN